MARDARTWISAVPRDIRALTCFCVGFLAFAVLLSRAIGAPFVVPRGSSPALGTNFSAPLVAALLGYALLQIASRLAASRAGRRLDWTGHLRDDFYLLAMFVLVVYVHFHIKMWVPLLNPRSHDAAYFAVDDRLRAVIEGLRAVRRGIAGFLPMPDVWYELAFFSMFSLSFWFHAAGRRRWHYHNMVAITLTELLGPLLYLVAPAIGPFRFEPGDNAMATAAQLRMYDQYQAFRVGGVSWLAQHGGEYFTAPLAAMPSLHFAATFVLAYYAVRARLAIAPLVVAATGWIAVESVASRWHYLVDVPVGLLVALAAIGIANRLCRFRLATGESAIEPRREEGTPPLRVWALRCGRGGDDAQILALAEALGGPFEVKSLAYRRFGRLFDVWRGTTLLGIDAKRSSPIAPPWPDLVISASMRNEPVCRWIRTQSAGATRYVHIGKPWAPLARFDLVIAPPEYHRLPRRPNVLHSAFSLHGVSEARLAEEARRWAPSLAHLPRPFVAVLVGGYAGPYALDREKAERLGRAASAMARKLGGSLLVTTSARTSRAAAEGLRAAIDVPHSLFVFGSSADETANPYLGFLASADSIVVTCDSTSMLAEACATRKPVYIFDLGRDDDPVEAMPPARPERKSAARWWRRCNRDRAKALLYRRTLLRFAPPHLARDIGAVHRTLLASGRAVWVGQTFPPRRPPPLDEMPRAVARTRALFEGRGTAVARAGGHR